MTQRLTLAFLHKSIPFRLNPLGTAFNVKEAMADANRGHILAKLEHGKNVRLDPRQDSTYLFSQAKGGKAGKSE